MPWVIECENGGYLTHQGHADASKKNAMRFVDRGEAELAAHGLPVVADTVRLGVDVRTANDHIQNFLNAGELDESVIRKFRTTAADAN